MLQAQSLSVMISALDFENEYVHTAYELLARILEAGAPKIWPFVNDFIEQFQTGSIIADVGRLLLFFKSYFYAAESMLRPFAAFLALKTFLE